MTHRFSFSPVKSFAAFLCAVILSSSLFAQGVKTTTNARRSSITSIKCSGLLHPKQQSVQWMMNMQSKGIEHGAPNQELIDKIKAEKFQQKIKNGSIQGNNTNPLSGAGDPVIGTNYWANGYNGYYPPDNTMAVSDGGFVVTATNSMVEYYDASGNNLYSDSFDNFFSNAFTDILYDPKVLYDPQADRFFMVVLLGTNSSVSQVLACFSQSNNPADGWWWYQLPGDVLSDGSWFDYPSIGVSNNEVYAAGNLFDDSNNFNQVVLYQMTKNDGYTGNSLTNQYWTSIKDGNNNDPFTIVPVSDGHGSNYGPGTYLVSNDNAGGNEIQLYNLTDDIGGSPSILSYAIPTTAYSPASDAQQNGTGDALDVGDCRIKSAFYLNGIIHFVFHSDIGGGYNGINYNRLNVSGQTNTSDMFGIANYDCAYPSLASFSTSSTDKSVMIAFLRSNNSIYPQVQVVSCDDGMNWSSSTLVKSGSDYVDVDASGTERWGDYSGMSRRHNAFSPTVWMSGCFGTSGNHLETWVAEVYGVAGGISSDLLKNKTSVKVYPNPPADIMHVELSLPQKTNLDISIYDESGRLVKALYKSTALAGEKVFSFNKNALSSGVYLLVVKANERVIKNEKIVIVD